MYKLLIINPGSTSTKIAVYHDLTSIFEKTIRHSAEEISPFPSVASQYTFREKTILDCLKEYDIPLQFDIVVGRGGIVRPLKSGAYAVNEAMKTDLLNATYGEHASNLGAVLADAIAQKIDGCRAIIADSVVVDELEPIARVSGNPLFPRISIFHALNQKAIARRYAADCGKRYEDLNLVIAHLGGGISVGAHRKGRAVDVNNALGYGPFSAERSGTVSSIELAKLCFSGKYTAAEVQRLLNGQGGLMAHLNTNNALEVEKRAEAGDEHTKLVWDGMAYNIAKEIGAMCAALNGEVDAILLTGGIAYGKKFVAYITGMVGKFAPVAVYPGEDELTALAENGIRVLDGAPCHTY
ncbi:MAG: butyrate kinase [Prevotellaceae bacterium]|jgi:butyrate kinase|nr:butyrate kinase [Prevotellaceae bacterium]